MQHRLLVAILLELLVGVGCDVPGLAEAPPAAGIDSLFSPVGDYPLGDRTDRFDYQSVDPAARRLYIAKMGSGQLLSFDLDQDRLAAALDDLPKVTGVLAVPAEHKIYASVPGAGFVPSLHVALGVIGLSSGRGAVAVFDAADLREMIRLPGGVFPDGIAYDPKERKIFVSDELGSAILVIDAANSRILARIGTGGEVGNVQYDPATERIYAPIQSRDELAIVDPVSDKLIGRYHLAGADHPHGLIIAPAISGMAMTTPVRSIGYIACDGNDRLLTVDLATGHVLARNVLAHDPDVLAIDATLNRLYVAGEAGGLSTFDIVRPMSPHALGEVFVGDNAHSVAVDPATHRLFFPLRDVKGQAVLRVLAPKP